MTKHIKDPIKFLRETGLLFEINRQILHPYGIAMGVQSDTTPEEETGSICLFDSRDDEEGFVYDPEVFLSGLVKTNNFLQEFGIDKLAERREVLGYTIQGHPDPHMKKNGVPLFTYNPHHDPDDEQSPNTVMFKVPYKWLQEQAYAWHEFTVDEFLEEYTYDLTEPMYRRATEEKVILEEEFILE